MKETHDFTEGKILRPLMKFAGPILLAMFLQSMYVAADLLIVGRFAATIDVSAVATGSQMMHSITGVITGLFMKYGIPVSTVVQILLCLLFMYFLFGKAKGKAPC